MKSTLPSSRSGLGRIAFIDFARATAIVLALLSHTLADFGVWKLMGADLALLPHAFTRSATPTFVLLFGIMLELVYFPRIDKWGMEGVAERLRRRSFQCYAAYLATVAACAVGGTRQPVQALMAAFLVRDGYLGNILKFYTVALLMAIPLVRFRHKKGMTWTMLLAVGIWALAPVLEWLPWKGLGMRTDPLAVRCLASFFFGVGSATGPSVLNGLTLVILGMGLGNVLRRHRRGDLASFYGVCVLVALFCGAIVTYLIAGSSVLDVAHNYVNIKGYRNSNHPGYYAIGAISAMVILVASSLLSPIARKVPYPLSAPRCLGQSSLLAFTMGNIILNLRPHSWKPSGVGEGLLASACVLFAVTVIVHIRLQVTAWLHTRRTVPVVEPPVAPADAAIPMLAEVSVADVEARPVGPAV
ncbi:MAG: hypothetical protein CME06_08045 [Gemmatimonadetes bacterium]|nr:hypothetical protein [Gemmatimonadota bacterium]